MNFTFFLYSRPPLLLSTGPDHCVFEQDMQDTLCTRTTFANWSGSGGSHNWTSRWVFFLLRQPLGDSIKDRATALQQMENEQRNAQTAARYHLVDVDAEFDT